MIKLDITKRLAIVSLIKSLQEKFGKLNVCADQFAFHPIQIISIVLYGGHYYGMFVIIVSDSLFDVNDLHPRLHRLTKPDLILKYKDIKDHEKVIKLIKNSERYKECYNV